MPQRTPCEHCHGVGLVRLERIITGMQVTLSYRCGACDHSWQVVTPDPRKVVRLPVRLMKERRRPA